MDAADLLPDPLAQFARWLEDARQAGVEMPEAMTLATADAAGRPSARRAPVARLDSLHRGDPAMTSRTAHAQSLPVVPGRPRQAFAAPSPGDAPDLLEQVFLLACAAPSSRVELGGGRLPSVAACAVHLDRLE